MSYFYSKHFYGVLTAIIALCFSLYYYKVVENDKLKRLNNFVLLSLLGVLVAVGIAFFDTEGVLLKYYPFRINTLTTFVLTLIISVFVFSSLKQETVIIFKHMTILISMVILLKMAITSSLGIYNHFNTNTKNRIEITSYIKQNTLKEDVVLSFLDDLSLNRRMERDRFVVYKFIPADMNAIPEWYERVNYKRALAQNISLLRGRKTNYKIDYFLSKHEVNSDVLELIFSNSSYYLYKVKP